MMPRQKKESGQAPTPSGTDAPLEPLKREIPDGHLSQICKTLGDNIRIERKNRGFSAEDMAEYIELSPSYIGLLERGDRNPSLKNLIRICELFGVTPDEFLFKNRAEDTAAIGVAEGENPARRDKMRAVVSLIRMLSEDELGFVIQTIKSLRNLRDNRDDDPNSIVGFHGFDADGDEQRDE